MNRAKNTFRRYYIGALSIHGVLCAFGFMSALSEGGTGIGPAVCMLLIWAAALVPALLAGGIRENLRTAVWVAWGLAVFFGVAVCASFAFFVESKGGEGPMGEGAPLATIMAMALFAAFFLCPWLLTALRGLTAVRQDTNAQQVVAPDAPPAGGSAGSEGSTGD